MHMCKRLPKTCHRMSLPSASSNLAPNPATILQMATSTFRLSLSLSLALPHFLSHFSLPPTSESVNPPLVKSLCVPSSFLGLCHFTLTNNYFDLFPFFAPLRASRIRFSQALTSYKNGIYVNLSKTIQIPCLPGALLGSFSVLRTLHCSSFLEQNFPSLPKEHMK